MWGFFLSPPSFLFCFPFSFKMLQWAGVQQPPVRSQLDWLPGYTVELFPTLLALNQIAGVQPLQSVTSPDLLSAVDIILEISITRVGIALEIIDVYNKVICHGNNVIFVWIPAGVDIKGNEMGDKAVKKALQNNSEVIEKENSVSQQTKKQSQTTNSGS